MKSKNYLEKMSLDGKVIAICLISMLILIPITIINMIIGQKILEGLITLGCLILVTVCFLILFRLSKKADSVKTFIAEGVSSGFGTGVVLGLLVSLYFHIDLMLCLVIGLSLGMGIGAISGKMKNK